MRNAKTLLELLTKEYPPFPGAKHALLVHEGKALIALAFGPANWQNIIFADADLDRAPEDLLTDIRDVLKAVEFDKAASLSADKIKAALAHVHAREKRVENPQGMTRLEATRATLQDFALNDAERGALLRALNIEPSEL